MLMLGVNRKIEIHVFFPSIHADAQCELTLELEENRARFCINYEHTFSVNE